MRSVGFTFMLFLFLAFAPAYSQTADSYGEVTVHTYYTSPSFEVINYYAIETADGLVLIDTGRLLSQARYALEELQKLDQPILAILLTHPHTDHFGGLPEFVKATGGSVPIYASQATYNAIATDSQDYIAGRKEALGKDFPNQADIPLPTDVVTDGDTLTLGGVEFVVADFPQTEADTATVYYLPEQRVLFLGDLVNGNKTPGLIEGHSQNWLAALSALSEHFPEAEIAYAGHAAEPGEPSNLIAEQAAYIEAFRTSVAGQLTPEGTLTKAGRQTVIEETERRYPDHEASLLLPDLIGVNADAVAEELAQENNQ